jgi:transposase
MTEKTKKTKINRPKALSSGNNKSLASRSVKPIDQAKLDLKKLRKELLKAEKLKLPKQPKPVEPEEIIRISKYNPVDLNKTKKKYLTAPFHQMKIEVQKMTNYLLYQEVIPSLLPKELTQQINLPPRLAQIVGKAASAKARSIKNKIDKAKESKKKKKYQLEILIKFDKKEIEIKIKNLNIELDYRFVDIQGNTGNRKGKTSTINKRPVDYWVKIISFPSGSFMIPVFKTRHMKDLENRGFVLDRKVIRINSDGTLGFIYKKIIHPSTEKLNVIKAVGVDLGRDTLVACSDGKRETTHKTGKKVKEILEILFQKKPGSKNFKQTQQFLINQINYSLKRDINWERINDIFIENLKDMKRYKKWGKKSHYWRVGYIRDQIARLSAEYDVRLSQVFAAYTSQECGVCNLIHKNNRSAEKFECISCGYKADANNNGGVNILVRGVNSSSAKGKKVKKRKSSSV